MKIFNIPDDDMKGCSTIDLERILLEKVVKLRKLNKETSEDPRVQKAKDALELAKLPFKKTRLKWVAEIEVLELELKSRNVKFNIKWDDIHSEDVNE